MTRDSTGVAFVDQDYHWEPITAATPRGGKAQLINQDAGVPQYGVIPFGPTWFTHWAPLPTFKKETYARQQKAPQEAPAKTHTD